MKLRALLLTLIVLALPSLAQAQYQHASFFNGGTTLTATCTNTTGTITSSDVFLGTAQGNTTVTLPASAIGCADYDVIDLRFTAAASQSYTLTVNGGTGTTTLISSNGGTVIAAPTGAASGAANILHQIWVYDAVATTPQWELVTQETNVPASTNAGPSLGVNGAPSGTAGQFRIFNTAGDSQPSVLFDYGVALNDATIKLGVGGSTAPTVLFGNSSGAALIAATSGNELIVGSSNVSIPNGTGLALGNAGSNSGALTLSNATGAGQYALAQAPSTTTYTETTKAVAPAQGDILDYSNATGQRSSLVDVAVGQLLASGGVNTVPAYSATPVLGVTTSQAGTLGLAKGVAGGNVETFATAATSAYTLTGPASVPAQGDLLTFSNGTGQQASVVDVAVGQVLESGGVGTVPTYNGTAPGTSGMAFVMTTAGVGSWTAIDGVIPLTGELGVSASTAGATLLVACDFPARAGHLTKFACTTDLSGTCTTAPTFGTRDVTSATNGTGTVACGNTAGVVTQATPGLAFAAGDEVCITRTVDGGTCLTTNFSVMAHYTVP